MESRGIDASSSPRAISAALAEYSARLPRAAPRTAVGTYNSQTLPLADPDLAADNYIGGRDPVEYFQRLYADRMTEDGGSRQIFNKMTQWASLDPASERGVASRGGSIRDTQWILLDRALRTGRVDPGLRSSVLRKALGVGLSETARHQQHKPKPLLSKLIDPIVQFGLNAIPVAGPALSVAYGAVRGGMKGGALGAFTGGVRTFAGNRIVSGP